MAVQESYVRADASSIRRAARVASVVLLALTLLFLLGTDVPATDALRTQPLAATSFLAMLFGLAIAWQHPLQGGATTLVAWGLLLAASRGTSAMPLAAFPVVGLLDMAAGWRARHARGGD
jgi:hypothetical protein